MTNIIIRLIFGSIGGILLALAGFSGKQSFAIVFMIILILSVEEVIEKKNHE